MTVSSQFLQIDNHTKTVKGKKEDSCKRSV